MAQAENFTKLFTINEANALLPIVRPIVEKILENIRRLRSASETVIRTERLDPEAPNLLDRLQENGDIARLIAQVKEWVNEIQSHGCICKGAEQGLIDFPCMLGNEVVFLCWQIGEPSVNFWHRIEDGFAGRKPFLEPEESDPDNKPSLH
ncbi:MAG: DUF2203 family protein [Deltaproteobacteria bacterium]|nr:DUF2203 family protein [Deltaproteobacteria bacterium]